MKLPRRLVEENELFAELVDEFRRSEPQSKLETDVLQTMASGREAAASARSHRIVLALAGVGCVALLTAMVLGRGPNADDPAAKSVRDVPALAPQPDVDTRANAENEAPRENAAEPNSKSVPSVAIDALPDSREAPPAKVSLPARAPSPSAGPSSEEHPAAPESAAPETETAIATTGSAKTSIRREVELVAEARRALARGDGRACLAALDRHDSEFPAGQFALEAKVMRIEAVLASGDRARARSLALDYVAKHPNSPYEARVRSLLTSTEER